MPFLFKTEPDVYSFADLVRDHETVWDGVKNPQAVKHLREMTPGELVLIYHTGEERRVVGTARVVAVDASDPKAPRVTIRAGAELKVARTLAEIKAQEIFSKSPLVTIGRLGVVPLSDAQYKWLTGTE